MEHQKSPWHSVLVLKAGAESFKGIMYGSILRVTEGDTNSSIGYEGGYQEFRLQLICMSN